MNAEQQNHLLNTVGEMLPHESKLKLLTYPEAPGHKADGPSREAAESEAPRARLLRDQVDDLFDRRELTADECASDLGASVLAIRPRLSELVAHGRIEDSGARRKNASGKRATVWRRWRAPAWVGQGDLFK